MKKLLFVILLLMNFFYLYAQKITIPMIEKTSIYAIEDGIVLSYGYDLEEGCYIEINYPSLDLSVKYCNLSKFKYFTDKKIRKGVEIGKTGFTGAITEPLLNLVFTFRHKSDQSMITAIGDGVILVTEYENDNSITVNYEQIGIVITYCNLIPSSKQKGEKVKCNTQLGKIIENKNELAAIRVIEIDKTKFLFSGINK